MLSLPLSSHCSSALLVHWLTGSCKHHPGEGSVLQHCLPLYLVIHQNANDAS